VNRPQAPAIFQKPIAAIDMTGLPPRGSPNFDQAVIARYALGYASRGWSAVVTVDNEFVHVVAIPENSIDPKKYVLGLLQHRYLEDALPILEALYGMVDDAEIAYNFGICLSELGRIDESVKPLERCVHLDHEYTNAYVGLGVAYTRLGRDEDAERALRRPQWKTSPPIDCAHCDDSLRVRQAPSDTIRPCVFDSLHQDNRTSNDCGTSAAPMACSPAVTTSRQRCKFRWYTLAGTSAVGDSRWLRARCALVSGRRLDPRWLTLNSIPAASACALSSLWHNLVRLGEKLVESFLPLSR
jgi:hypothetical protein